MGLMSFFQKEKPAEQQPTAVEYVEWLLKYMIRTSRVELVIDTRRPLPGGSSPDQADPPPCIPEARAVINRLKILAGVNPMSKQPVTAGIAFQRPRTHDTVTVLTQFQEDGERSACTLRLQFRINSV